MPEIIRGLAEKIGINSNRHSLYRAIDWPDIEIGDGIEFEEDDYAYMRVMASRMSKKLKRKFVTAKRDKKYFVVRMT